MSVTLFCAQMIQKARVNQGQIYTLFFYQFFLGIFGCNGPNCIQIETDGKLGDGLAKWVTLLYSVYCTQCTVRTIAQQYSIILALLIFCV